jgi:predicted transcriptional regulator of viral defense system
VPDDLPLPGTDAGRFDRIARGIYLPADAPAADWAQIEAVTCRPNATICLTSALSHHDLADTTPSHWMSASPTDREP